MQSLSSWLSDVSRRKLSVAALGRDGLRDTINLHRFVLLKNSITQAHSESLPPSVESDLSHDNHDDILLNPDGTLSSESLGDVASADSEEKWLESVLETLDDDRDRDIEVDVHPVEEDDDTEFSDIVSHTLYDSWSPHDVPSSMTNALLSSASLLSSQPFSQTTPIRCPFGPLDSPFIRSFVEPRYPEADYDLPISDSSSDSDSDDDGPLTPYGGSRQMLDRQAAPEPDVYVEHDSYFLYPSELDPISPQSIYYQQC